MSRHVLEILDGDQAGTVIPLTGNKLRIGRKPENDLVLGDEKCSGNHAEIICEDGAYVLRDLGSTNGSLIDGRKITEVALSSFDVFQLGRVRIRFQVEGATDPAADMQLSRINQAALPTRRGSGMRNMVLIVLLVVSCCVLVWLQFFAPRGRGLGGPRIATALAIEGNLLGLDTANLEGDIGWELDAAGSGFEPAFGRRDANTGSGSMLARRDADGKNYALARTSEAVRVLAGTTIRIRAHLRTEGDSTIAVRARFGSSENHLTLCSGSVPASYDRYRAVDYVAVVPQGMDQLTVEILALLPEPGMAAFADDIAVLSDSGAEAESIALRSRDGRSLRGIGSSVLVHGTEPTLCGIRPLVDSQDYADVANDGHLVPSDIGMRLEVTALEPSGFRLAYSQAEGFPPAIGLVVCLPAGSRNIAIAAGDGPYVGQPSEFTAQAGTQFLLGHEASRCLLRFPASVDASGRLDPDGYEVEFRGGTEFTLHLVLDEQARQARDLLRQARDSIAAGGMQAALDSLAALRTHFPHDESELRTAEELRRGLLAEMVRRVDSLREDAADVAFFQSSKGMSRVHAGIADVLDTYGAEHLPQTEMLAQISAEMMVEMQKIATAQSQEHAGRLRLLEAAFRGSLQVGLADLIADYLQRHGPPMHTQGEK